MKKYNPDAHCPKCDWPGASTTYKSGVNRIEGCLALDTHRVRRTPDVLVRQCGRCEYRWEELPLDSEEEDNG